MSTGQNHQREQECIDCHSDGAPALHCGTGCKQYIADGHGNRANDQQNDRSNNQQVNHGTQENLDDAGTDLIGKLIHILQQPDTKDQRQSLRTVIHDRHIETQERHSGTTTMGRK